MATLALEPVGEGGDGGLPLQLTTITVAVPQPLSPGTVSVLQGHDCGSQGFKWKYEQPKPDKQGCSLVSRSVTFLYDKSGMLHSTALARIDGRVRLPRIPLALNCRGNDKPYETRQHSKVTAY